MKTVFFCVYYQLWLSAPTPDTKDFSGKVLCNLKSFAKVNGVFGAKVFADFQGDFYKKPLEARFGTQFQYIMTNKKARRRRAFFCVYYQLWLSAPTPDARDFSGKVPWNFKSFCQSKMAYLVQSSYVYLSFNKGKFERSSFAYFSPKEK